MAASVQIDEAEALVKLKAHIKHWRVCPYDFVVEVLHARPTKQQERVLRALETQGAKVAVKSCHGAGKSALVAWIILWAVCCFADVKVAVTAPTAHQLNDVIKSEVEKWRARMPEALRCLVQITADKVSVAGLPGFAAFRTGRKENPEALQGFHAKRLLFLIDEASGIDEKVFEVAQGALTGKDNSICMFANPTRTSGFFYNAFHKNKDFWTRFTFSALESPNVEPEFVEQIAKEYGTDSDMYRVRVLGEFPNASDLQFIPASVIDAAFSRYLSPDQYKFAPVVLGVDVALYGGDRAAIHLRQGLFSKLLFKKAGVSPAELASITAKFEDEYRADGVIVDATGVGEAVIALLREYNRHPIPFYGAASSPLDNCLNARVAAWWKMRDWLLGGGSIDAVDDLREDLAAPEYGYSLSGKVKLESKDDMRKRGLLSPDCADSLALTFGAPVAKRQNSAAFVQTVRNGIVDESSFKALEW